ncbi:MAG: polyprenol monophosphomannose synthase [Actinomycetota bacterium]|nr:polyprenol monophosphomannose synthase [Actinomycetota bacterium]
MPPDVVAVIPTYNEVENLARVVAATLDQGYRVLVVDDASPDGTGELADRMAIREPRLTVLHRSRKEGLGRAYSSGFRRALQMGAEVVCEMDADSSHDPSDLPRLVRTVQEGADVALGSRYVKGGATPDWPAHRRFLSRAGNLYARTILGLPVRDVTGGFRAFRPAALQALEPATCRSSGYAFQVEMVWRAVRAGMRVVEVPVVFRDRRHGSSKMTGRVVLEAMWLVTRWGVRARAAWLPFVGEEDPWT